MSERTTQSRYADANEPHQSVASQGKNGRTGLDLIDTCYRLTVSASSELCMTMRAALHGSALSVSMPDWLWSAKPSACSTLPVAPACHNRQFDNKPTVLGQQGLAVGFPTLVLSQQVLAVGYLTLVLHQVMGLAVGHLALVLGQQGMAAGHPKL